MKTKIKENVQAIGSMWFLWLFPDFAILISVGLFRDNLGRKGPEIGGLETILEGTYIAILPGKADAEAQEEFEG